MSLTTDINSAVDAAVSVASPAPSAETTPQTTQATVPSTDAKTAGLPAGDAVAPPLKSARVPAGTPSTTDKPSSATQTTVGSDPKPVPQDSYPSQDKWPQVLENARAKESRRVEDSYGVPLTEWQSTWKPHVEALKSNPVAYYKTLGQQLQTLGLLPTDSAPAQPVAPPSPSTAPPTQPPQPDLRAEDGRLAYSAEQTAKLIQWEMAKFEEKLGGRFKPFEDEIGTLRDTRMRSQATDAARTQLEEAATWPDFDELRPEIARRMREDGRVTLQSAYIAASKDHRPQVTSKIREGILQELKKAPVAPTTQSPSRAALTLTTTRNGTRGRGSLDDTINRATEEALARLSR